MNGSLEQVGGQWKLSFVRNLSHPPHRVWSALSEPEELATWFPTEVIGERAAGAPLRFVFPNGEAPPFDGRMIAYEPPSLLEFLWGEDQLRFSVEPDGAGTVLALAVTFDELGKASRDAAGWHTCLDVLEHRLAGEDPPWKQGDHWQEVHDMYVARFGPEASTLGPPEPTPEDAKPDEE
jgi:uncharacterized protein YndB with AHSA1/START domain